MSLLANVLNTDLPKLIFLFYFFRHQPSITAHLVDLLKEWKFCQFELGHLQGHNLIICPTCSIFQHSCHVDGNMKLYRYSSSGGQVLFQRKGLHRTMSKTPNTLSMLIKLVQQNEGCKFCKFYFYQWPEYKWLLVIALLIF